METVLLPLFATQMLAPSKASPMGVLPRNATAHSAITRPRILGSEASCNVLFPLDRKATLAAPTASSATSSKGRFGAMAAAAIAMEKKAAKVHCTLLMVAQ